MNEREEKIEREKENEERGEVQRRREKNSSENRAVRSRTVSTLYGLDDRGSRPVRGATAVSRPALELTQSPTQ